MTEAPSIRRRLSRALVVISLCWGGAVALVVSAVIDHEVDEIMDATLRESSEILQPLLGNPALQVPLGSGSSLPAAPHREEVVWQIVDVTRGVLLRSHDAPAVPLTSVQQRGFVTAVNGWRVHVTEFAEPGRLLMVGEVGTDRREAKVDAIAYTVAGALLVGLLCAAWMDSRVSRELSPLQALTGEVARFDPLKPGTTLPDVDRQELQPVRDAIASLGTRLAARVAHERAFAAHAAHALRTPLAGMMAQLAAAHRISSPPAQPMLAMAREAADHLRHVVSGVLTIFRSGQDIRRQPIDLSRLVDGLRVEGLAITVGRADPLHADPDLLAAALANLLDNAARHGATRVAATAETDDGLARIVLRDDGPGVDPARRELLQRLLDSQTYDRPVGMGLMLADWVARAHGGSLVLPGVESGFVVELRLGGAPLQALRAGPASAIPDRSPTRPTA